jgi:tetratricopeptide (TPR) repeat protein
MALILLTIIFIAGGFFAVIYSILALLSILKHSRTLKILPEKHETESGKSDTSGPPVADAYIRRARILLQNEQFVAALADCKRAIDINANHAEAHTLWEHALDKEIPPGLITEPPPAIVKPVAEAPPAEKKVKKVVKRIKRKKKVEVKPALIEIPDEAPVIPAEEAVPEEKIVPEKKPPAVPAAEPEEEILLGEEPEVEEKAEEEIKVEEPVEPEPVAEEEVTPEKEPEVEEKTEEEIKEEEPVEPEPVAEEVITPEKEPEIEPEPEVEPPAIPAAEPEVTEKVEEEIKEEGPVEPEPVPEEEIAPEKEPEIEPEPEVEPPAVPAAEPEVKEKAEKEIKEETVAPEPPSKDLGPLIPEDKLVKPEPKGKSLLEEVDHEKLREFEEGEAGAGDSEWTRYADKNAPELAESKIDMNELPAEAVGLKETLTDLRQAEAYNLQGETNISKNLYNNAIKDFSRALEINPNYIDALINRGGAYAQLGRSNDALIDFNHALNFEKKDAELYNKRGEVFMQNNMYDQAIKDFTAAIVLNPVYSDAYLNRGRAYSEKGMPDEASTDFNNAIKADSDHNFAFIDRAAPGVHVEVESESNPEKAEEFNAKGLADLEGGKFKEATENFTKAIENSSSEPEGYINRGRTHLGLKKPDDAMDDFNQAVLFDPLNAALYYWRAQAWKLKEDEFNMKEDLKLSCEMGHEPACIEYGKLKPTK